MKSKISDQKLYECILITTHREVEDIIAAVTNDIDRECFSILHKEFWDKRVLAYKINKNKKGYYSALYIRSTANCIDIFNKNLRMYQDIIRSLVLVTDRIPEKLPPIAQIER